MLTIRLKALPDSGSRALEQQWRSAWQRNLLRAGQVIIFRAVYALAHRVFLHQPSVEGLKAIADSRRIHNTRVEP